MQLATDNGIKLTGTSMTGRKTPDLMAGFEIDEKNRRIVCPHGKRPTESDMTRAQMQQQMHGAEYEQNYWFRNGVEAIPSKLRRDQNIDRMPFRGLLCKKQVYALAVVAINARRVVRYAKEDGKKALFFACAS